MQKIVQKSKAKWRLSGSKKLASCGLHDISKNVLNKKFRTAVKREILCANTSSIGHLITTGTIINVAEACLIYIIAQEKSIGLL